MFSRFSRVEQHFLKKLQGVIKGEPPCEVNFVIALRRKATPVLELMARQGQQIQPVQVQVHGLRPVRYHLRTLNTPLGRRLRKLFSMALGEENLDVASSLEDAQLTWVFRVHYPEEVVRRLSG
ncbi:MAG: hypothetical protein AB7S38_18485 [Vulcanimicrobiota bacterium]